MLNIYDISSVGMDFQRMRLEAVAANIANMYATRSENGALYQPLDVIATVDDGSTVNINGMQINKLMPQVIQSDRSSRLVYDPTHPNASFDGFVEYPDINVTDEMLKLAVASRAYEANVKAMSAARAMALRALEIGKD